MINRELKKYIETNIFPSYQKNDLGHNLDHIKYVIKRSLKFAKQVDNINYDMVYAVAAYHDIGHYIDAKNHEKISADILFKDQKLREFFDEEQIKIMYEAVFDHRASKQKEPRNIYGKIVLSADNCISVDEMIKKTYEYIIYHRPNEELEQVIEDSRQHTINKYGKNGYAIKNTYFKDIEYEKFLKNMTELSEDKEKFKNKLIEVNKINIQNT